MEGKWIANPGEMKSAAVNFFSKKFHEKWVTGPKFCSSMFRKLSETDADFLEPSISIVEIKNSIWACSSEKAPGPDGFTLKNFKFF